MAIILAWIKRIIAIGIFEFIKKIGWKAIAGILLLVGFLIGLVLLLIVLLLQLIL